MRGPGPGPGGPGMPTSGGAKNIKKAMGALIGYCRKYVALIVAALVFAAISAVLSVIGPDYISELTETITSGISPMGIDIDMEKITSIAVTLIVIYAVSMTLAYLQSLIMAHVSCNVGKKMRSDITAKINRIPLKYFDSHNHGDTLSRVTNDVDMIGQSLNMSVGSLVSALATLIGCIIMMFATEWRMALNKVFLRFAHN